MEQQELRTIENLDFVRGNGHPTVTIDSLVLRKAYNADAEIEIEEDLARELYHLFAKGPTAVIRTKTGALNQFLVKKANVNGSGEPCIDLILDENAVLSAWAMDGFPSPNQDEDEWAPISANN